MESCIHLTLYHVELVSLVFKDHPPSREFEMKGLFLWTKGRIYSRVIDNAMGIIYKDSEGKYIPMVGAKPTNLPFFSIGAGKELVSEYKTASKNWKQSEGKYWVFDCQNVGEGNIPNTTVDGDIENVHYIHEA